MKYRCSELVWNGLRLASDLPHEGHLERQPGKRVGTFRRRTRGTADHGRLKTQDRGPRLCRSTLWALDTSFVNAKHTGVDKA
jgi:hypothetical protein